MAFNRSEEIFQNYLAVIDQHLIDLVAGNDLKMLEMQDLAAKLFIHPTHLSNVVKELTGKHPCFFYEEKILKVAKDLLKEPRYSIAEVARMLDFDPSNFTKWFKMFAGMRPSEYRKQLRLAA